MVKLRIMKKKYYQIYQGFTPLSFCREVGALYILMLFATIISITSCKKTTSSSTNSIDNLFTERIDNIKLKEPVLLSFGDASTAAVDWQITPNNNFEISKVGKYATVKFNSAGVYTAIAKSNNKQATYIVTVVNTLYSDIGSNFSVAASKIVGVNVNEDVFFTVNNPQSSNLVWSFKGQLPNVQISLDKKSALVSFKGGASGTATVSDGISKQSRTVFLNDASSSSVIENVPLVFGDKLTITPSVETDINGIKTLKFAASTTFNYQCNTDKILSAVVVDNSEYQISYGGVAMASNPCSVITTANCSNGFVNMPVGLHPFSINYENKTFTGTIDVSASGVFSFNWNNNNLIALTSFQVSKGYRTINR